VPIYRVGFVQTPEIEVWQVISSWDDLKKFRSQRPQQNIMTSARRGGGMREARKTGTPKLAARRNSVPQLGIDPKNNYDKASLV
jgi:hypothetical protein